MKWLAITLGLALMSGCGGFQPDTLTSQPANAAASAVAADRFAAAFQSGAPQMQLGVERAKAAGIVVLDVSRAGARTWLSPEGASFTTRDGLLVATRGLGGDMLSSDVTQTLALLGRAQPGQAQRFHTFLNGADKAVTQAYVCDIMRSGARVIRLHGTLVTTTLMTESCTGQDIDFQNLFWIETGSGQIVQSRQWAGEPTGPLALRPLRHQGQ